ncbi:MAG: hypothetical protein GX862_05865 [Leucobacter sp.]|nr:hypothetical protein [Leucobacter sp.]
MGTHIPKDQWLEQVDQARRAQEAVERDRVAARSRFRRAVLDAYENGIYPTEIARRLGVNRQYIHQVLEAARKERGNTP